MSKIDELKNVHKDLYFVQNILECKIPEFWKYVLSGTTHEERKERIIAEWRLRYENLLSKVIGYLNNHLIDVELISYSGGYSLLYSLIDSEGEEFFYEGGNPYNNLGNKLLDEVPTDLKKFYLEFMDGFYLFETQDMGIIPLKNVFSFSDYEWGIIDDLEEPLQINLDKSYGFYFNGAGGYLVIDCSDCIDSKATRWFDDEQPKYGVNFWDYADRWIELGFE